MPGSLTVIVVDQLNWNVVMILLRVPCSSVLKQLEQEETLNRLREERERNMTLQEMPGQS